MELNILPELTEQPIPPLSQPEDTKMTDYEDRLMKANKDIRDLEARYEGCWDDPIGETGMLADFFQSQAIQIVSRWSRGDMWWNGCMIERTR
jgi:hypothetical protein